jgi:hypothetical protein
MRNSRTPKRRKVHLALEVNGEAQEAAFLPHKTLLEVLREDLGLTGTKHGCELGECGTCTVLIDGRPELSCLVLGLECRGRKVVTVEGLGSLHRLRIHDPPAPAPGGSDEAAEGGPEFDRAFGVPGGGQLVEHRVAFASLQRTSHRVQHEDEAARDAVELARPSPHVGGLASRAADRVRGLFQVRVPETSHGGQHVVAQRRAPAQDVEPVFLSKTNVSSVHDASVEDQREALPMVRFQSMNDVGQRHRVLPASRDGAAQDGMHRCTPTGPPR